MKAFLNLLPFLIFSYCNLGCIWQKAALCAFRHIKPFLSALCLSSANKSSSSSNNSSSSSSVVFAAAAAAAASTALNMKASWLDLEFQGFGDTRTFISFFLFLWPLLLSSEMADPQFSSACLPKLPAPLLDQGTS